MLTSLQRVTLHRVIPGNYPSGARRGIRTTVFGEKRKFRSSQQTQKPTTKYAAAFYDPKSEGRQQKAERLLTGTKA
jgi:sulfonate dioxygenase